MKTLSLHNTLGGTLEPFVPADPKRVTMYVCGPTVYNFVHIGNGRPVVVFDVLFRVLRTLYGPEHVIYARNITDVDDKINQAAAANGEDDRCPDRTLHRGLSRGCRQARGPAPDPRAARHRAHRADDRTDPER
jgi:cysteinyl-tRNA synthetase